MGERGGRRSRGVEAAEEAGRPEDLDVAGRDVLLHHDPAARDTPEADHVRLPRRVGDDRARARDRAQAAHDADRLGGGLAQVSDSGRLFEGEGVDVLLQPALQRRLELGVVALEYPTHPVDDVGVGAVELGPTRRQTGAHAVAGAAARRAGVRAVRRRRRKAAAGAEREDGGEAVGQTPGERS